MTNILMTPHDTGPLHSDTAIEFTDHLRLSSADTDEARFRHCRGLLAQAQGLFRELQANLADLKAFDENTPAWWVEDVQNDAYRNLESLKMVLDELLAQCRDVLAPGVIRDMDRMRDWADGLVLRYQEDDRTRLEQAGEFLRYLAEGVENLGSMFLAALAAALAWFFGQDPVPAF